MNTTEPLASTASDSSPAGLIEVRGPYFALHDVAMSLPGHVSALAWSEQAVDLEVGQITAAEAGRHMAILGSIASATHRQDPSRRFYFLAERALLTSPDELPSARSEGPLRLEAHCTQSTTRQAQADCQIQAADGQLLFGLNVTYKLVPEKVFQRLFAAHRVDMRSSEVRSAQPLSEAMIMQRRQRPYRRRLNVELVEVSERRVHAQLATVPAEACAGHFPLYPAVPVAVLMEAFSNAGGALLRRHLGQPELRYRVRSADILASKLVFAGQAIRIRGELLETPSQRSAKMHMEACLIDGEQISHATFVMEGVPSSSGLTP